MEISGRSVHYYARSAHDAHTFWKHLIKSPEQRRRLVDDRVFPNPKCGVLTDSKERAEALKALNPENGVMAVQRTYRSFSSRAR